MAAEKINFNKGGIYGLNFEDPSMESFGTPKTVDENDFLKKVKELKEMRKEEGNF